MSSTVWWILAGSIPVALVIMLVAFLIMKSRINKVKKENNVVVNDDPSNPALNREGHGQLMWELKEKAKNPLADLSLEFAINTILRNKFQRLVIAGFEETYEEQTLITKTQISKSSATFDFALINFSEKTIDQIDDLMKRAEPKSIIMIVNTGKSKQVKELLSYLKYTGVRNEQQKIDEGIILIAK